MNPGDLLFIKRTDGNMRARAEWYNDYGQLSPVLVLATKFDTDKKYAPKDPVMTLINGKIWYLPLNELEYACNIPCSYVHR